MKPLFISDIHGNITNLLKRNFYAYKPNQKWSTDITYIIHNGKRAYLSSIMDLYSRDIIAYKISYKIDNKLVMDTLNEAIRKKRCIWSYLTFRSRFPIYI